LKKNLFINIYYQHELSLFSKEFKEIKERLKSESFHFLIELNQRANISLPYLIPVAKRVCYYQNDAFPYYNILMSGGTKSFEDFFNVEKSDIENLFHFKKRDLSAIFKRINKKRPFLFVNGENHIPWEGDRIVCGKDVLTDDIAIYHILYLCDSYYGRRDEFYELAKIFQKEIIEDKNL
jgi:hypothetical protein